MRVYVYRLNESEGGRSGEMWRRVCMGARLATRIRDGRDRGESTVGRTRKSCFTGFARVVHVMLNMLYAHPRRVWSSP